ncbi:MAG: hypothetical protein HFE97_10955 [Oscillospiraceae bacterium]|nr:hypothetical protein [Oscillospiraceae bacterium]
MIVQSPQESVVKLDRLYVKELSFWRTEAPIDSASLTVEFQRNYRFNETETQCTVELTCTVKDEDDSLLHTDVVICGLFSCEEEDRETRLTLLKKNTLAILFPYLRSQICLITSQPDLSPITLPTMNINAVFETTAEGRIEGE